MFSFCLLYLALSRISCCVCFGSSKQDNFFLLHVENEHSSCLESVFKTELLTTLCNVYRKKTAKKLKLDFNDRLVSAALLIRHFLLIFLTVVKRQF